jgi:hypothetical protein
MSNSGQKYSFYVFNFSLIAKKVGHSLEICLSLTKEKPMRFCTVLTLLLFFQLTFISGVHAQNADKEKGNSKPFPLGFGINVGNIRFYNDAFQFGLSPNVALPIGESAAVGLMLKLNYNYERFEQYGNQKFSAFDIGPTIFARWKPLQSMEATPFLEGLFLQAEFERASIARPFIDSATGDIFTMREPENYLYVGIGASSGYPFSTFFSLHYNVLDDADASRIPWDYRIGFTYNY